MPSRRILHDPSKQSSAHPGNDKKKKKKLDTDGSHAKAEAWPQAYHSTPPSEAPHKPVLLQGQSLDLAWASFWAVISCPLVFPGLCPAGINCPKPTHQRLLSFFFFFSKAELLTR